MKGGYITRRRNKMQDLVGEDDPFDCFGTDNSDISSTCSDNVCVGDEMSEIEVQNINISVDGSSNRSVNSSNSAESS